MEERAEAEAEAEEEEEEACGGSNDVADIGGRQWQL